jgi:transcriptional regulator with XRE-family HTH domain
MLGDVIRAARVKKNLTQVGLARQAGVSRRHLAALEKGANVSVLVLGKVAAALGLTEIDLGDLSLRTNTSAQAFNLPLLTETIQEARNEAVRAQALLARAETLLVDERAEVFFPRMPARVVDVSPRGSGDGAVADNKQFERVAIAADVRQGTAPKELKGQEVVTLPANMIEKGEIVFRARGDSLRNVGIEDGDLLVIELRPRGRAATGELVIGRVGEDIYVGRWWQKHGSKSLMTDTRAEIAVSGKLKIVAVINSIIRPRGRE